MWNPDCHRDRRGLIPLSLPNPMVSDSGHVPCNKPLVVEGHIVGYCDVWVKRRRNGSVKPHRGPHRIEWSS